MQLPGVFFRWMAKLNERREFGFYAHSSSLECKCSRMLLIGTAKRWVDYKKTVTLCVCLFHVYLCLCITLLTDYTLMNSTENRARWFRF